MNERIKISFVVPNILQKELREQMIHDNYGLRGKSQWVSEAIERLINIPNYIELVFVSDELKSFGSTETITVDRSIRTLLDSAIVDVRKIHPMIEGVQSRIIRTAIMQRLLRS